VGMAYTGKLSTGCAWLYPEYWCVDVPYSNVTAVSICSICLSIVDSLTAMTLPRGARLSSSTRVDVFLP